MQTPQTILILGTGTWAIAIAQGLSKGLDKVVLCDEDQQQAELIVEMLKAASPDFDIEWLSCSYEACWEADMIFFTQPREGQLLASQKLKAVANQKIVVAVGGLHPSLKEILPHSKLVSLQFEESAPTTGQPSLTYCLLQGADDDAVAAIAARLNRMGYRTISEESRATTVFSI